MKPFQLYLIFILLLSCQFKRNSYDINIEEKLSKSQLDSIEMESYYGYDSLDLGEYQTKFGHLIQLQGSKSGSLYRIKVKTKDNRTRLFEITDNPL
jgi:hypothetical protein